LIGLFGLFGMQDMRKAALLMAVMVLGGGWLGGCNIAGPALLIAHGPEKTKRVHTLDPEKVTVMFIDDRQNRVPRRAMRVAMTAEAERTLLSNKVVKDMVAGQSALVAAGNDRSGRPAPIAEIGRAVEAQTVIYATIDEFTLSPDGQTYAPTVRMRVMVVDVESNTRVWPADPTGHPVFVRPKVTSRDMPTSIAGRFQAEEDLATLAGLYLANLFFDHERPRGAKVPD
jgi:hypothetical protein